MDLLSQLISGELRKAAAKVVFTGRFADVLSATQVPLAGLRFDRFDQCANGGEQIDVLGDQSVGQLEPPSGQVAFAVPREAADKAAQFRERNEFLELLLHTLEARRQAEHVREQNRRAAFHRRT